MINSPPRSQFDDNWISFGISWTIDDFISYAFIRRCPLLFPGDFPINFPSYAKFIVIYSRVMEKISQLMLLHCFCDSSCRGQFIEPFRAISFAVVMNCTQHDICRYSLSIILHGKASCGHCCFPL